MRIYRVYSEKRTSTQEYIIRGYLNKQMNREEEITLEVEAFRSHLKRLGYGKSSVQMLPNCLREFLCHGHKRIEEIRCDDVTNYHHYLECRPNKRRSGGLSESYIHHHIYSLRLFFSWQLEQGLIKEDPMSGLIFKSPRSEQRQILSLEEIMQMYNVCESQKEKSMLSIFYGCGLRRSEGERLDIRDVHFRSGLLYVRQGKGNKRRTVPMSRRVADDLKNYVYEERYARTNEMALIANDRGLRMKGSSYNKILKEIIKRVGIKKKISLHSLRHSIATHLLEGGLSIDYVRDFLGHKHLESTQIYTRVDNQQLWDLSTT